MDIKRKILDNGWMKLVMEEGVPGFADIHPQSRFIVPGWVWILVFFQNNCSVTYNVGVGAHVDVQHMCTVYINMTTKCICVQDHQIDLNKDFPTL